MPSYGTYGDCSRKTVTNTSDRFGQDEEADTIFRYNGRDGVVTDSNGMYYMRSRYYSPYLMRFINADVYTGSIENSPTLNRYAYANGIIATTSYMWY